MKNYKKMLYVIDMVKGFVTEGVMHDEYIGHTVEEQVKLIKKFKKENQGIALVGEGHSKDCVEFKTFPEHCVIGTSEADFVEGIREFEEDAKVYRKNSTSALFAPGLMADIEEMKDLEEIVVCGCCTDICVINFVVPLKNYFNQINKDVKIFVVESATETYGAPNHNREEYNEMAYKLMKQSGIEVVKNVKELEERENQLKKGGR